MNWRALFGVLLLLAINLPTAQAATLFESNWSTATGNSVSAFTDGNTWDTVYCQDAPRTLTSVAGASLDWTLTPNVLRIQQNATTCGMLEKRNAIPISTSHWGRMYFRNDEFGSAHNHVMTYNALGAIQVAIWNRYAYQLQYADGFATFIRTYYTSAGTGTSYPTNYWTIQSRLSNGVWYRYEWHMEYVTQTTYRIWPRIYDMQENLLFNASSYFQNDYPQSGPYSLTTWYAAGNTFGFSDVSLARHFGLGNEGPGGSTATGLYWYHAAVKLSTDGWIGGISTPPEPTIYFQSNWSTTTGTNIQTALLDGGRWNFYTCWNNIGNVMEVIPGTSVGWTATPNVMQFTQRGSTMCGNVETQTSIPELTNFYARMYIRNDDTQTTGWHDVTLNCCGSIQSALWSREFYNSTHYRGKIAGPAGAYPYNLWFTPPLARGQWYRYEWYVEYVDSTNARIWTRVYDMQGNRVADENSILNVDTFQVTLAQRYAQGYTVVVGNTDLFRRFGTGNPGQGGSADTGEHWYNAAVEVRGSPTDPGNDIWVGPINNVPLPTDITSPTATITAPTTAQILVAGTTSTPLTVTTNEASTCRWSTTDIAYGSMTNTMTGSGSTSHSSTLAGLTNGGSNTTHVRCSDTAGNAMTSSTSRTFSVARSQTTYFASNWSAATGTSRLATGDAGTFDTFYCDDTQRARVQEVVPGAQYGWTATPNILQMTMNGTECGLVQNTYSIPAGEDYFTRAYIQVLDANSSMTNHPYKTSWRGSNGIIFWSLQGRDANAQTYRPTVRMRNYGNSGAQGFVWNNSDTRSQEYNFMAPALDYGTWYRFEHKVEYVGDPSLGRSRPAHVRIYDMDNNLIANESDFVFTYMENTPFWSETLENALATGAYYQHIEMDGYVTGHIHWPAIGFEGPFGNPPSNEKYFFASFAACSDWCGPIGGGGIPLPDTTPPTATITTPTTAQVLAFGTTQTTLSVTTNEASTCRWSASSTDSYAQMTNTMTGTGTTSHSAILIGLVDGTSYTRFIRCSDTAGNAMTTSQSISFSVANPGSITNPTITVDSTYAGYTTESINDGVINAAGGTSATWASDESTTNPHWIELTFPTATALTNFTVHWAQNGGAYMTSAQVQAQRWDGSAWQTVATMTRTSNVASTTVAFTPLAATRYRLYQNANQGNPTYTSVLWITEIDYETTPTRRTGDLDGNGIVNINDVILIIQNFKRRQNYDEGADINSDGTVNIFDMVLLGRNWG